jgi:RNA polymerase sigma-70 factor, ECF subfamily
MLRSFYSAPMTFHERVIGYFEQLQTPIFLFLLRRTHDASHAEDLTQETFLRLCRHLHEGRPIENPQGWLFTVAANLATDLDRQESNIKEVDENTWKQIENSWSGMQLDPETILLQSQCLDRLQIAVSNLTSLQRECLHLRAQGLRYREIANLMEMSLSTVAASVRRATLRLGREVDSPYPFEPAISTTCFNQTNSSRIVS